MKDIKDYLHLYWGCEVSVTNLEGRYNTIIDQKFINTYVDEDDGELYNDPKPILRPLSDMTEEEKDDFADHGYDFEDDGELPVNIWKGVNMSGHVLWLLSKGFDLFGLIEAGLAIDRKTLKTA